MTGGLSWDVALRPLEPCMQGFCSTTQHLLLSQILASLVDHWGAFLLLAEEDAAGEWLAVPYVPCLCGWLC